MKALIGPANSGKSERIISRVAEAMTEARGYVSFIVPSSYAATMILESLQARLDARSVKSTQQTLTTFPQFYSAILGMLGRRSAWLSLIERDRLLRRVIFELEESGRLVYFANTSKMPGLVSAVAGLIDELWQAALSTDDFNRIAGSRGRKDQDLALIYKSYADNLNSLNATDTEAAGYEALRALRSTPLTELPRFSLVAADGFDFYSPVQTQLLTALASRGVETIVSLTYEAGRATHLWQQPTFERLRNAGAELVYCSASPSTVIEATAARFMNDNAVEKMTRLDGTDAIHIISAPDRAAEVRAVAREIKKLAIENDFAPGDIAVVCRSLSLYSRHIERVFRECSIPLEIDCSLAVAENPAIQSLLRLLALSSTSFPRRATIECLRSPYFDYSSLGLDETATDLLDQISLEKNVTRGRDQWLTAIESFANGSDRLRREIVPDEDEEGASEKRKAQCMELQSFLDKFFQATAPPGAATASAFAKWIIEIAELLRVREMADKAETASRDAKALAEFHSIVNSLAVDRFQTRQPAEYQGETLWHYFFAEVERALSAATYDRERAASSGVTAQEAHKTWTRRYRALFVLGLVEGEFPAKTAERAPFTNREREELRDAGIDLTETAADAGGDLAQFSKAISRATERLYLSNSRTDLTGGELLPSYLIEEISAVATVKLTRIQQSFASGDQSNTRHAVSLEELAALTARALRATATEGDFRIEALDEETRSASRLLGSQLPSWKNTLRGAAVERRRLQGGERGCYDGIIRDRELIESLASKFGPAHLWSASQINDYGSCPFRFFAKYALKLEPVAEPGEGFRADKLGNAYHKILERLYARLQDADIRVLTETSERAIAFVDKISDEVLQGMLDKGTIRRGVLWDFEKREIKRRIARLLVKEAEWNEEQSARPVHLERKFGSDGEKPLVIETEEGQIRMRGQIDRIDKRDDGGWVVIDYKTGRTPIPRSDALDGRNLQLPIYAMAATRAIDNRATVVSAYYLHIGSRKKGSELSRADDTERSIEKLIEHAEKLIVDYVRRARKGAFPVKPNSDRCYTGCEFDVMCRIQSLGSQASDE